MNKLLKSYLRLESKYFNGSRFEKVRILQI